MTRPTLRLVATNERPKPKRLLPDYPRIHTTIIGSNGASPWGRAGPFILSEKDFHELSALARRLADDGGNI